MPYDRCGSTREITVMDHRGKYKKRVTCYKEPGHDGQHTAGMFRWGRPDRADADAAPSGGGGDG